MLTEKDKPSWLTTLVNAALVSIGSLLVLFPAWLPRASVRGVDLENSTVELLQIVLLLLSMAILLAASAHAGRLKSIYQALALGAFAAAIGAVSYTHLTLPTNREV